MVIGWPTTWSADSTPPLERMIEKGGGGAPAPPASAPRRRSIPEMYRATVGFTAASTSVVIARSYSRYSGSTSAEMETTAPGSARSNRSRTRSSCAGLA